MKVLLLLSIFVLGLNGPGWSQQDFPSASSANPVRVIFDTDFGPDYDDVGALTMLHCFADSGYVSILATMASSKYKNVAAAINVFNSYFGRPEIPVGVVRGKAVELGDKQHWTDSVIRHYPHRINNNSEAFDACFLYRKILSLQPDSSVTIVTVGFFTNLANLLVSPPDSLCVLNGYDLVKRKVRNLVSMAGRFPAGNEFNLAQDVQSSKKILADWPTPILFSGFEIGWKIRTGLPLVQNERIRNSPVRDVFSLCIPLAKEDSAGRMSWDETAVLVAIKGWGNYYNLEYGHCVINDAGYDEWDIYDKRHARLVEKIPPSAISNIINQLIQHQPVK